MEIKQFNIETREDIEDFFVYLHKDLSVNFHPEDPFTEYVNNETGERTFTDEEAEDLQDTMDEAYQWAEDHHIDLCEIALIVNEAITKPVDFNLNSFDLNSKETNAYTLMRAWKDAAIKADWMEPYIDDVMEIAMDLDFGPLMVYLKRFSKYGIGM